MILEIDIGNTFAKWRLMEDACVRARGRTLSKSLLQDNNFANEVLATKSVHRIRLASVLATTDTESITQALSDRLGVEAEVAHAVASQAGLVNSYQYPSSMGVDRWLAMLAAFNCFGKDTSSHGCLVVSCGTAMTIDSVRKDGQHDGGYIVPGLHLMRDSLLARTGRIQFDAGDFSESRTWGTSTAAAVERGAIHTLASAVEQVCHGQILRSGSCTMVITGGDAMRMFRQLDLDMSVMSCHYVEDLVLDGLQYALP